MANGNSIPTQVRAVDPFASYNSDTVNKLTRMLTYGNGQSGLSKRTSCEVSLDSTSSTQVIVSPGEVYKDDVWISLTQNHIVDFTDPDQYYNFDTGFDEVGWYYVVLSYQYQKQRPAPQASILILKPSQRSVYTPGSELLFLKAVEVNAVGPGNIVDVSSHDPENTDNKRLYIPNYAGTEVFLPPFDPSRDKARVVFVESENQYYFGYEDGWGSAGGGGGGGSTLEINTLGFQTGDLVYVNNSGSLSLANASLGASTADGVVITVDTLGLVQMSGRVEDVRVETGQSVNVGNLLYLSKSDPGTVTTQKSEPFHQFVGRCAAIQDSTTITALFVRGEPNGIVGISDLATYVYEFIDSTSWTLSGLEYYVDIDTSDIDQETAVIQIWNDADKNVIVPSKIDAIAFNQTRVWMPVNTESIHFLAIGPSSSTMLTSNVISVTDTIVPLDWQGAGPYYYDVDVSSIENGGAVARFKDVTTDEVIEPQDISFDSTNVMRVYMPTNTETLDVVAMGPTSSISGTTLIGLTLTLASGASWIPDGSLYYQEINLDSFGSSDVVFSFEDADTGEYFYPSLVDYVNSGNTIRIWMPDDTHNVNVTLIG